MIEQLQLKEIVGYLPYDLQSYKVFEGIELIRPVTLHNVMSFIDNDIDAKIVLRPLSDLTKEIEHNGENIIPFCRLNSSDVRWLLVNDISEVTFSTIQKLYEWHF